MVHAEVESLTAEAYRAIYDILSGSVIVVIVIIGEFLFIVAQVYEVKIGCCDSICFKSQVP